MVCGYRFTKPHGSTLHSRSLAAGDTTSRNCHTPRGKGDGTSSHRQHESRTSAQPEDNPTSARPTSDCGRPRIGSSDSLRASRNVPSQGWTIHRPVGISGTAEHEPLGD